MYDQILFPTDGSEPAASVLDYALQIASEHGATIHVLNVVDTSQDSRSGMQDNVDDALEQDGTEVVNEAAQRATEHGIDVVSEVLHGDPYEAIVEYSTQSAIELIVIPTHGRRGLQRFLLGSVTERVINTAEIPVIAVNPGTQSLAYPCQDLLGPTDGSRGSELALAEGVALANATGATLHLLHVVETGSLGPDARSLVKDEELTTKRTRSSQTLSRPQRRRPSIASRVKSNSVSRRKKSETTSMQTRSTSRSSARTARPISADI